MPLGLAIKTKDKRSFMKKEFDCPLCKKILSNPSELRKHRLQEHRSIMDEIAIQTTPNT